MDPSLDHSLDRPHHSGKQTLPSLLFDFNEDFKIADAVLVLSALDSSILVWQPRAMTICLAPAPLLMSLIGGSTFHLSHATVSRGRTFT